MFEEHYIIRDTFLVRRLTLAPGEAIRWHKDPFHRVSVVLSGECLLIEYRNGAADVRVAVTPGQVDWEEPGDRIHRAINDSSQLYEEVTTFFLRTPNDVPQPDG